MKEKSTQKRLAAIERGINSMNEMYENLLKRIWALERIARCGFARNDDYARQRGLMVAPDLSEDGRGKWSTGWRKKVVDAVFSASLTSSGRSFDGICREVYAAGKKEFDRERIAYDAFKRACDRQNQRKSRR